jgi:hypothetical protein
VGLQERLVVALQVLLEHDATHVELAVVVAKPRSSAPS